jgi:alpha-methylacyl-CoA racemase
MTGRENNAESGPLEGMLVLDLSRMLPGAVLARILLDLGARLVKVEDPESGDVMRHVPPLVGGVGTGFCTFLRGCESLAIDLSRSENADLLRRMARRADVLVESFRPGRLETWGLGTRDLQAINPRLVICSLSGFGQATGHRSQPAHDLNFLALSGLLSCLRGDGVPGVQIADVTGALLAAGAVLAALLARQRSGVGRHVDQPLAIAPLPFLAWAWADGEAGGQGASETILSGRCPAYRTYPCGDGGAIAVGAIEPKFWVDFVALLGLPHLAAAGYDSGENGRAATREITEVLSTRPREEWLVLMASRRLPVSAVHDLAEARREALFRDAGWLEQTPAPGGGALAGPGPFMPSVGRTPSQPVALLGEHNESILREFATTG